MRRIAVVGSSGAGKSTLSRRLGQTLHLPVVHLDTLYYRADWQAGETSAFDRQILAAVSQEQWIIDGNFLDHQAAARFQRADLVIWVDQPLILRLLRAAWRGLVGRPRPDLPTGCRDNLDPSMFSDILRFDTRTAPAIRAALSATDPDKMVCLRGDRAIRTWLETIKPLGESSA